MKSDKEQMSILSIEEYLPGKNYIISQIKQEQKMSTVQWCE